MKKFPQAPPQPGALEIIESATGLLRRTPAIAWLVYAAGSLVFVMAALEFVADMGRAADAAQRLVPASLFLALAYGVMKYSHALFGDAMLGVLKGDAGWPPRLTIRQHVQLFAGQMLIHATMPWIMFLSLLAMLPAAWTHAAYHNASILAVDAVRAGDGVGVLANRSLRASHHAPRQNHALELAFFVITLMLGLNFLVTAILSPHLVKIFSGSENALTLNPWAVFNTTVLAAVAMATWLAVNPLVRACHALRCFHFLSRRNGDDLRATMRSLPMLAALVLAMMMCLSTAIPAEAGTPTEKTHGVSMASAWVGVPPSGGMAMAAAAHPAIGQRRGRTTDVPSVGPMDVAAHSTPADAGTPTENIKQFDKEMDDVLARPDFRWRLPREEHVDAGAEKSWLQTMIDDVIRWLGKSIRGIFSWADDILRWIFGGDRMAPRDDDGGSGVDAGKVARIMLVGLLALGLAVLLVLTVRWWRLRGKPVVAVVAAPVAVDLADESITADALPEDEWLRLAREKWHAGDHRLALRALFLGSLARLGDTGLLGIASGKTNGIYLRELSRQSRATSPVRDAFRENVVTFESTWYGDHPVDDDAFARFSNNHETIRNHASPT